MAHFKLLGTFSIEQDGQFSHVMKSDKGSGIVAYLIVTQQLQTRERIADIIWDVDSTQKSLQNLRQIISAILRGKVAELNISRKSLSCVPTENTTVNLYDLEQALDSKDVNHVDQ